MRTFLTAPGFRRVTPQIVGCPVRVIVMRQPERSAGDTEVGSLSPARAHRTAQRRRQAVRAGCEHWLVTAKRSDYGSLADQTSGPDKGDQDRALPVGVHVWVRGGSDEAPGLLSGWSHGNDGWWGRVVTVTNGQPSESLIRAALLRKVS